MKSSFLDLLRTLHENDVEFVVVGGVAALIEGAPITTLDLDVVYRVEVANITRLQAALESLGASYRDPAGRTILPSEKTLISHRVNLLETSAGLLDALQDVGENWGYDEVKRRSSARTIEGLVIHVLGLEGVIATKEAANRPKDQAALPVLRATLSELRKSES